MAIAADPAPFPAPAPALDRDDKVEGAGANPRVWIFFKRNTREHFIRGSNKERY